MRSIHLYDTLMARAHQNTHTTLTISREKIESDAANSERDGEAEEGEGCEGQEGPKKRRMRERMMRRKGRRTRRKRRKRRR